MMVENMIKVGMADLKIAIGQNEVLKTTGLGSCVGLTLYDPVKKIAGMAHVMLPNSDIARDGTINLAKYADTAIPEMIRLLKEEGVPASRLIAKMAGGAQMFVFASGTDTMRIGPRNVESCKDILQQYRIPLEAEDTGENFGRTIEFYCATGILKVRSVQQGVKEL